MAGFATGLDAGARVVVLGQKLVQLAMPGVPDVYQGCELVDLSLVDPDNRRDVDFDERRKRLQRWTPASSRPTSTTRSCSSRRAHCGRAGSTPTGSWAPRRPTCRWRRRTGNAVAFGRGATGEGRPR